MIFETVIDNGLCYKNPTKRVSYTSNAEKTIKRIYTEEQIEIVESYAAPRMPEVVLLLETRLRRGELLGLKWEDINWGKSVFRLTALQLLSRVEVLNTNPPKWKSYPIKQSKY